MGSMARQFRARRSCLAVPGNNPRMFDKARTLPVDHVLPDLEDACAPRLKEAAREPIVAALNKSDWDGKIRTVRVNDWTTKWTYGDVISVVAGAGDKLDCIILPKVQSESEVAALDMLLSQVERAQGLEVGRTGMEVQIETARGLMRMTRSPGRYLDSRPLFRSGRFSRQRWNAYCGRWRATSGYEVADACHYSLMRILIAARTFDVQAIDGAHLQDPRHCRIPPRCHAVGSARLRRKVGPSSRPDPGDERGVFAGSGGLRPC
jgi:citrate lyase subunit beta/citryl-CoA lyase